jgi:hypothetical protein
LSTARCLRHLSLKSESVSLEFKLSSSPEIPVGEGVTGALPLPAVSDQQQRELVSWPGIITFSASYALTQSFNLIKESPGATLTRLALRGDDRVPAMLENLLGLGKLSSLAFLGLGNVAVTDEQVRRIAAGCSMLEYVEFSGLKITGIAVKELCLHTKIIELVLLDCCDISADAIEWARARGVMVMVKHSEPKTGRRIRHG